MSGSLVCCPGGVTESVKYQIPEQGFGGNGVLHSPDLAPGKPLYVGDLTPGQATIFKTALQNSGVRAVYVRLQVRLLLHLVL